MEQFPADPEPCFTVPQPQISLFPAYGGEFKETETENSSSGIEFLQVAEQLVNYRILAHPFIHLFIMELYLKDA